VTTTTPPRLALLDGHGIIFRAFFAQRDNPLSVRRTGERTAVVFAFTSRSLCTTLHLESEDGSRSV
jgi:hypothetical protein